VTFRHFQRRSGQHITVCSVEGKMWPSSYGLNRVVLRHVLVKSTVTTQLSEEPRTLNTILFVPLYIFIVPGKMRDEAGPVHNISRTKIAAKMKLC
jgi:hypothetical protein